MKRCKTFLLWWMLLTPMWGQSIFWGGGSVGAGAQWAATAQQRLLSHVSSYATGVAMAGSALEYGGFLYWIGRPLPLGVADAHSSDALTIQRIWYDRGMLFLTGIAQETGFVELRLITMTGAVVAQYSAWYGAGSIVIALPISGISSGIYIVQWRTPEQTARKILSLVR